MEALIHSQRAVYALYGLAGIFILLIIRNFIRRKLRRIIWLVIASMVSGGTGHAVQQSIIHEASQYAVHQAETYMENRLGK